MPEPPAQVVARVAHALAQHGTPARAESAKAYLKSDLEFLGVEVPRVRKAVAELVAEEGKGLDRARLVALAAASWKEPVWELRSLAIGLLEKRVGLLGPDDLPLIERLTREGANWALCDWLSIHVAGPILAAHPKELRHLDRWAKDKDLWVRRLALTCQRNALSKGTADWARFCRIADGMLHEKEFFIRKAVGWMLREACKADPEAVAAYVAPRASRMSALTLREATRRLPEHLQALTRTG
jgi:3-methyladenine DNA glycosylase AlkD